MNFIRINEKEVKGLTPVSGFHQGRKKSPLRLALDMLAPGEMIFVKKSDWYENKSRKSSPSGLAMKTNCSRKLYREGWVFTKRNNN